MADHDNERPAERLGGEVLWQIGDCSRDHLLIWPRRTRDRNGRRGRVETSAYRGLREETQGLGGHIDNGRRRWIG
jgi:hypothetical protein